jgi:hypothetical protein
LADTEKLGKVEYPEGKKGDQSPKELKAVHGPAEKGRGSVNGHVGNEVDEIDCDGRGDDAEHSIGKAVEGTDRALSKEPRRERFQGGRDEEAVEKGKGEKDSGDASNRFMPGHEPQRRRKKEPRFLEA